MPTLSLTPPADFFLPRDVCSYGYFLLAPNYWDPRARTLWRVLNLADGPILTHLSQSRKGAKLAIKLSRTPSKQERTSLIEQVTRMLRLDESAEHIKHFHKLDKRHKTTGRGRLFRSPTLFEDVIKTVTSCNVTWPSTINMNKRLCEVVGEEVSLDSTVAFPKMRSNAASTFRAFAFPTAAQLADTRVATLRARCRVGYRDQRIVDLAKLFSTPVAKGGFDIAKIENPATPDNEVFESLIDLPGIGSYAAANIMQLLGRYARLPLDTESVRHGRTMLGFKGSSAQVMRKVKKHFEPMGDQAFRSYWFEMWTFYESKHGPAWNWERDTTGRMFTAALLK